MWVLDGGLLLFFFLFFVFGVPTQIGLVYQAPTEWVICVGAFCTDSLVYQAPTEWVICAGSEGIFFFFSGGNGFCLGFGGFVCVCVRGSGFCFGVWDLMGSQGAAREDSLGAQGGVGANLELPRGMSATTLPGGKYPYGICQNREEWGARECLLIEVWKYGDLSAFKVLLLNRGRYWVTWRTEVHVASPATPMIYIFCRLITQVAGVA